MSSNDGPVRKLVAIAGMLGSDHDGERANAARLATIELQRLGLTWSDLVLRAFAHLPPAQPTPRRVNPYQEGWEPQTDYRPRPRAYNNQRWARKDGIVLWDIVRYASLHGKRLNSWEVRFIDTLLCLGPKVTASEAQWRIVFQIADKLNVTRAA